MEEHDNFMHVVSTAYWNEAKAVWETHTEYFDSKHLDKTVKDHTVAADDCHVLPLVVEATMGLEPSFTVGEWLEEEDY